MKSLYMHTIAMIIPYYGRFPWYFTLFLHSASRNPSIDILIITDLPKPVYCPDNVRFIKMSLSEVRELISRKLNLDAQLYMPYKLCDFKPAYGFIFSDLIKDYDFWGYGDIDLIYGNIRKFMTEDLLSSNDFINARDDYVTGFFSLLKNTKTMNTLFMKSKDYKKAFSQSEYCGFDECAWDIFNLLTNKVPIHDIKWEMESMSYIIMKYNEEKYIKAHFDFIVAEGLPGKVVWNNGTLICYEGREILLYHLIDFKKRSRAYNLVYEKIPNWYYIDTNKL